jgi:hypothetical protein
MNKGNNERNLLRVLLLSQALIYSIDEVENNNKFWQQDIKRLCKNLTEVIIKKHGAHIKSLFEANGGEFVGDLNTLIETLMSNLCTLDLVQWGAMTELSAMVIENPHVTLSEEEKDKLVNLMRGEIITAINGMAEAESKVDKLHTKISKMTAIGKQPFHAISSDLIEIKRYLRKVRTGSNEGIKNENQPCARDQEVAKTSH